MHDQSIFLQFSSVSICSQSLWQSSASHLITALSIMPLNRAQKRKRFRELALRRHYPSRFSTEPAGAEVHVNSELNVAVEDVPAVSVADNAGSLPTTPVISDANSVDVPAVSVADNAGSLPTTPVISDANSVAVEYVPAVSVADNAGSLPTTPVISDANSVAVEYVPAVSVADNAGSLPTTPVISDANSVDVDKQVPTVSECLQTPVVSNSATLSKPKAKRAKVECVVSEDDSCVSDSTSDDENIDKHDEDFILDASSSKFADFCFGNGAFIGQKSQMQDLIDQINKTSKCSTKDCNGLLKPVNVQMVGFGGTVRINYDCTGCLERRLTFNSSALTAHDQPDLSLALQVGFVAAGCSHAQYRKVLAQSLGMQAVSFPQFYKTLKMMHPVVKQLLDDQCDLAKGEMKSKPDDETGSFKRAVTNGDGAWMTRGSHSQNFTFHLRDYFTNAMLYYEHLCQRGEDETLEGGLFKGTSRSAEGHAADKIAKRAKDEGMNIAVHWQDDDSSASKSFTTVFPDCKIMLCGGHAATAHEKMLKLFKMKRAFTANDIAAHAKNYPAVLEVKCCCPKKHHPGCGCFSDKFIRLARSRFFRALCDAGNDPAKFISRLTALYHHARDIHAWEVTDGDATVTQTCDFHPMFVCSCGNCKKGELTCLGKPYKTTHVISCPFHGLFYQIECERRAERACDVIHPVFGRGHTNSIETANYVLTVFRPKSWHLTRLHYELSTNLGLLQSNMNYMNRVSGMSYHWLSDLYQRLQLPLLDGMEAVLKQANIRRVRESERNKTEAVKRLNQRAIARHRGEEQVARQKWVKSQKVSHTYGITEESLDSSTLSSPVKAESPSMNVRALQQSKMACKCGSTSHSRTSHRDCPFNKGKEKAAFPRAHDSCDDDEHSEDEMEIESAFEDLSSDDEQLHCACPNGDRGTHLRSCHRHLGAKSSRKNVPNESTCSRPSECQVVEVSNSSFQPSGPLPSPEWKQHACEMVSQWSGVSVSSELEPVQAVECPEISPHVRDSIVGDGHCLFRSISKELTGTQTNHKAVRLAVSKFLTNSDNAQIFGRMLFEGDNDPLSKVTSYTSSMCHNAWGTDKEITVAATMLQVDILVYSQFGKQGRKWLKFTPAFSNHNCTIPSTGITLHLYHTPSKDHYDRVIPCLVD